MIYDSAQSPKITNTIIMEWILFGMGSDRIPIQIPDDKQKLWLEHEPNGWRDGVIHEEQIYKNNVAIE